MHYAPYLFVGIAVLVLMSAGLDLVWAMVVLAKNRAAPVWAVFIGFIAWKYLYSADLSVLPQDQRDLFLRLRKGIDVKWRVAIGVAVVGAIISLAI